MIANSFTANLEYYKVFFYVAELGSISAAAERLYLTQPTVTKAIQRLEEQLSCALFTRTKRGVKLTAEGQALWQRIEPACNLILSGENELRSMKVLDSGTVSIASTEFSFKTYVLPTAESFMEKHPGIKLRLANALKEHMCEMLKTGAVDIAILLEPFNIEDYMNITVIDELEEVVVAGMRYKHLAQKPLSPSELLEYPFIGMPEGSSTHEYLRTYFAKDGVVFEPELIVTMVELTLQAIERGLGIGVLPIRLAEPYIKAGTLVQIPLKESLLSRKTCVITNRELTPGIAAKAFIKEMKETVTAFCGRGF